MTGAERMACTDPTPTQGLRRGEAEAE